MYLAVVIALFFVFAGPHDHRNPWRCRCLWIIVHYGPLWHTLTRFPRH